MRSLVITLVAFALAGCASTVRDIQQLTDGTCQSECRKAHPDSLYDENRCLERMCEPPE